MPNSSLDKYRLNFSGGYDVSDKFKVSASIQYSRTDGKARPGVGYSTIMSEFRQWWATNVDMQIMKDAYFANRQNQTWNWANFSFDGPIYWNNPYWDRYENYETDQRDRYFGYAQADYSVTDWLSLTGRVAVDSYSMIIEERVQKGSIDVSSYQQTKRNFSEFNYDLLANFNKQLTDEIALSGVIGANIRRNHTLGITAQTNGGLIVPGLYALNNSVNPIEYPNETDEQLGVNGYFAQANFNYDDFLTLEFTGRRDQASSLPEGDNVYYYPSASASFIFSEFIDVDWMTFGKIRGSWAEVGNTADPHSIADSYVRDSNFGSAGLYSLPNTKNNPNLKPERTKSWEVGLQMRMFNDRLTYDINYYDQNTIDQILATEVSRATGYAFKFVNAGNIENRGVELTVTGKPVVTKDFAWTVTANWNKNVNEIKALAPGIDNYQLASPQGNITISAALGEAYGALRGSDFVYDENGNKLVDSNGFYQQTATSNNIIGNMNPDWTGGLSNRLNYKNWTLNFLIDVRWGGDIFSLDQYYGQGTGLYPVTAGLNDKGNPKRDPVSEGGGVVLPGYKEDGSPNDIYVPANTYAGAYGWINNPSAQFIYDGSYIKLREVGLTYTVPQKLISKIGVIRGASVSVIGRNLWIIHKNIPHADPEQSLVSGNVMGYQGAVHPSTRDVAFNLQIKF
jgi:outer membrane receptor protein involved in Fe transport